MKSEVTAYYDRCGVDYRWLWGARHHGGMHLGFYDDEHRTHRAAVVNQVRRVADRAGVDADTRVLDAGCGRGGPAVWIADQRRSDVVGVDLTEGNVAAARDRARGAEVADATEFGVMDFTDLALPADSVDAAYFIESCCYARDPRDALAEARRVLRPGGRLVVADGFETGATTTDGDRRMLDAMYEGWAVPGFFTAPEFRTALEDVGFEEIEVDDVSEHIWPSSRRLFLLGMVGWPGSRVLEGFGLRSPEGTGNARAAYYQHRCLRHGLTEYAHVSATAP